MKKKVTKNQTNEVLKEIYQRYKEDPVFFVEHGLGHYTWSKQREMLQAVKKYDRIGIRASHSVSKTYVGAEIVCWFLNVYDDSRVITTAPCFDDKTETLTNFGWKFFKDLNKTEKVASLVNGKLEFVVPEDWMEYKVEGELVGYKGRDLDFFVTPHHKLYTARLRSNGKAKLWKLKKAEECFGQWDLNFNREVIWEGIDDEWSEKHYELFGFWFADGYARNGGKNRRCDITLTQANFPDYALNLLKVFNKKISKQKRIIIDGQKQSWNFTIYDNKISKFFVENFYNEKEKTIPYWIKNSTPLKLKAFIRGFMMGDGDKCKNPEASIRVRIYGNKKMSNDIQEIGLKAGFIVNLREIIRNISNRLNGQSLTFLTKNKTFPKTQFRHWYKQLYRGFVYCVKVSSGILLIRRNGVYHWSGNTGRQVRDLLWAEIGKNYRTSRIKLEGECQVCHIRTDKSEHYAEGFSTDEPYSAEGFHAKQMMFIFDEAKGIPQWLWDSVEGSLSGGLCKWLCLSTTDGVNAGDNFYKIFKDKKASQGWFQMHISAYDNPYFTGEKFRYIDIPDKLRPDIFTTKYIEPEKLQLQLASKKWIGERETKWGRDSILFLTKVKGEILDSSIDGIIKLSQVCKMFENDFAPEGQIELGVDVARGGDDDTVIFKRHGMKVVDYKVITSKELPVKAKLVMIANEVKKMSNMDKRVKIKVDDTGVGGGVTDILENEKYNIVPINFQSVASDKDKYPSIISEMWYEVAEQIENISCPGIERLQLELTNRKGDMDSKGRRMVESKDDYKKRRNASPDMADAFLLCFYKSNEQPVRITRDTIIMSGSYETQNAEIFQTV